jgi:NAD+-dependent farnesol dehydrogenase
MKIFLTGGNGFLGSRLVDRLMRFSGHELVLLVRDGREANVPSHAGLSTVTGDLTDPASYEAALEGCDAVIHTAAVVSTWVRDRSLFDKVNVRGTLELIEKATARGVSKILYVSSFLALPPSPDSSPLDELSPVERTAHYNDYERTKYTANIRVAALVAGGAPVVTLYPTVMYGPGPLTAGNLVAGMLIDHMRGRLPARLGDGSQTWNFVFADDVADGVALALDKAKAGERFILGGENITLSTFFEIMGKVTDKTPPRLALPWKVARVAGAAEELLAWLTGRTPQTTRGVIDIFRQSWAFSSARAMERLDYAPRTFAEGLESTVEWIRREGLAR